LDGLVSWWAKGGDVFVKVEICKKFEEISIMTLVVL
jgi:hypothetical protein